MSSRQLDLHLTHIYIYIVREVSVSAPHRTRRALLRQRALHTILTKLAICSHKSLALLLDDSPITFCTSSKKDMLSESGLYVHPFHPPSLLVSSVLRVNPTPCWPFPPSWMKCSLYGRYSYESLQGLPGTLKINLSYSPCSRTPMEPAYSCHCE